MFIVFKKIEFVLNGKVLLSLDNITLPDALNQASHLNPIENTKLNIVCYYY